MNDDWKYKIRWKVSTSNLKGDRAYIVIEGYAGSDVVLREPVDTKLAEHIVDAHNVMIEGKK